MTKHNEGEKATAKPSNLTNGDKLKKIYLLLFQIKGQWLIIFMKEFVSCCIKILLEIVHKMFSI